MNKIYELLRRYFDRTMDNNVEFGSINNDSGIYFYI